MSVQTEIDRIITAVQAAHEKVAEKGGTTAQPYLVANLASAIDSIPDASDPVLQEKTVTPKTSAQSVTPDSGYDGLSKVTVNAIPSTYVKPTATKAATTYTPTTSNQTISAGTYCSGAQTIKGDANLVAGNIKSGVSIFGVAGSYEGSGGGSSGGSVETCTVTITTNVYCSITATTYSNGEVGYGSWPLVANNSITIENIVKHTLMSCNIAFGNKYTLDDIRCDNMYLEDDGPYWATMKVWDYGATNDCSCELTWA